MMVLRAFCFVVPAKAGTHTPCPLGLARWQRPFVTTSAGGYGSRRSRLCEKGIGLV